MQAASSTVRVGRYISFVFYAAEVEVTPGCETLNVRYTVNSLPDVENNEASLGSLVVRYQSILGGGSTGSRTVPLNRTAAEGVLSLTGLTRDTAYRVTYRVEIAVSFQVTLPSDIADPIELHTTRTCPPGQWSTNPYCLYVCCVIAKFYKISGKCFCVKYKSYSLFHLSY